MPTGNANLAKGHNQELATRKLVRVFLEHDIEPLVEDQLAEIAVG